MVEEMDLDMAEQMLARMDLEHILFENDVTEEYALALLISLGEIDVGT